MKFTTVCALASIAGAVSVSTEAEQNNMINTTTYGLLRDTAVTAQEDGSSRMKSYLDRSRGSNADTSKISTFRNRYSNRKETTRPTGLFQYQRNTDRVFTGGCHWKPSTTFTTGWKTLVPAMVGNSNERMSGFFSMLCTETAAAVAACRFTANAQGFFVDRKNHTSTSSIVQLNMYMPSYVSPTGTDLGYDAMNIELGSRKINRKTNMGKDITYSNDGTCRVPKIDVRTVADIETLTDYGAFSLVSSNAFIFGMGVDLTSDLYVDSHYLAYKPDVLIPGTYSFDMLEKASVALAIDDPTGPPIGCCKVERWGNRSFLRYQQKAAAIDRKTCQQTYWQTANSLVCSPTNAADSANLLIADIA